MATRKPDRGYPEVLEDACMDRNHPEAPEGQEKEVNGDYITHDVKPVDSCGNVTQHEAVEGRISEDCNVNEVTATNNKTSAERNVGGQTGQNGGKQYVTIQNVAEKLNTSPQRLLLCSRCQAALRHKNIVRRISVTENWTGTCAICKHLLYVGEYEVMDKRSALYNQHQNIQR